MLLCSCRDTEYNYNCGFAASTPTDLKITNNTARKHKITLKVYENSLNTFKQISISANESELLCVEYEGPITNGIHIEFENQTTIIRLKPQKINEFVLKERTLR
jgi:hypothetical protein